MGADNESIPLWAVESSDPFRMNFEPLWGLIDRTYENMTGFGFLRAEKLWLPINPHFYTSLGASEGYDALAAVSGFIRRLSNLYGSFSKEGADRVGEFGHGLYERWHRLSENAESASLIPSLILADGLANGLVGTKTSISVKNTSEWPPMLSVDDTPRGIPRAKVVKYKRVIRYDIRYAIPGFIVLAMFIFALLGACGVLAVSPSLIRTIGHMYNQTSPGRLATRLLLHNADEDGDDPKQPSSAWVEGDGKLQLSFGRLREPEEDHFCKIVGSTSSQGTGTNGDYKGAAVEEPMPGK